jgi:folylpolyglutamate synthase/dihydropteroate synthase
MIAALLVAAGETVVASPGQNAEHVGAGWVVFTDAAEVTGPLDLLVFTPIMPAATHAGAVAERLCSGLPPASMVISAPQRESAIDVLRHAFPNLLEVAQLCRLSRGRSDLDGQEFRLKTPANEYHATLPVLGAFQVENAATALLAVEQLAHPPMAITPQMASTALATVRLPGRLELLKRQPQIFVDSCSNMGSLRRAVDAIRDVARGRRLLVVLDLESDLDPEAAVEILAQHVSELFLLSDIGQEIQRALREICYAGGSALQFCRDVATCVDQALSSALPADTIVVLGSAQAAATARAHVLGLMPPGDSLHYTG